MDAAQLATITDPDVLRALVANKVAEIAVRDETIRQRDLRIEALTHEIARLRRVQFQARSERMDPDQRALFDEAMLADLAAAETELEALTRTPERDTTKPRTPPRRRPLPSELPRIESVHEPACTGCSACGGDLVRIGEHVRERLDCKPLEFFVRREVFPQYACRACERVVAQPVPPAILDRSQAAPGLLAQVATAKYLDHLPLYRQEAIYARSGVELSRSTLAEWIGAVGVALAPLVAAVRDELLTRPVLHADETPVAQLDPGAGRTKREHGVRSCFLHERTSMGSCFLHEASRCHVPAMSAFSDPLSEPNGMETSTTRIERIDAHGARYPSICAMQCRSAR